MKSEVAGVDFRASATGSSCCEVIGGKKYITLAKKDSSALKLYSDWVSMSGWLALFAHEARHADGPGHVTGCPAFPLPTDPFGCDATYDPTNISSYGIQYWLYAGWITGYINVGIACASAATVKSITSSQVATANLYPSRFVTNAPPTFPTTTVHGGLCFSP
jgi:hypothetical protein